MISNTGLTGIRYSLITIYVPIKGFYGLANANASYPRKVDELMLASSPEICPSPLAKLRSTIESIHRNQYEYAPNHRMKIRAQNNTTVQLYTLTFRKKKKNTNKTKHVFSLSLQNKCHILVLKATFR